MGEKCQLYRPDKLYASSKLIILKECDERQHRDKNYECEVARPCKIYDEFKNKCKFVVTRWNPDHYKHPDGLRKVERQERLELDLYVTEQIIKFYKILPHNFMFYMFYSEDNPMISPVEHVLVYSKADVDKYIKGRIRFNLVQSIQDLKLVK